MDYRDHRTLDRRNAEDKRYLTDFGKNYITLSRDEMDRTGYVAICNKISMYIENQQVPVGISDDSVAEFVRRNVQNFDLKKFQVKKDKFNIIYFTDNRVGEMYNGYLAEFTKTKKTLSAKHDKNPRNDKIEWAVSRNMEGWERKKRIWTQVRQPTVGNMLKYNRGFTRPYYDDFAMRGVDEIGDICMEYFSPLQVLVDPFPTQKFIRNSRYIIPFKKIPIDEVRLLYQSLGYDTDKIVADTEADEIMTNGIVDNRTGVSDQFVTVYYPEWKQFALDSYKTGETMLDPENNTYQEAELKGNNCYYFEGIYTTQHGMMWWRQNPYADIYDTESYQFSTIPYEDMQSDLSVLGCSRIGKCLVVQDLLNVILTLKLNSERFRAVLRGFMAKQLGDAIGTDNMMNWMNMGGLIPVDLKDVQNVDWNKLIHTVEFPGTGAGVNELLVIIDNVFKRQAIRKEVLTGQLPTKSSEQMSGTLARELKDSNNTLLMPITQNIEWAVETEGRLIMRMWQEHYGEDDWIEVTDQQKGDPKYTAIEATWPAAQYYGFLQKSYPGMDLIQAGQKFNEKNDVKVIRFNRNPETKQALSVPEQEMSDIFIINSLKNYDENGQVSGIHRFGFKVYLVFNAEDTQYEDKLLAGKMFTMNPQSLVLFEIFLEQQGGYWSDNKDTILESYKNEQDAMKKLAYIESMGPEFWQAFMGFAQQWQAQRQMQAGQPNKQQQVQGAEAA